MPESGAVVFTQEVVANERIYASIYPLEFKSAVTALMMEFVEVIPRVMSFAIVQADPFFKRREMWEFQTGAEEVTR